MKVTRILRAKRPNKGKVAVLRDQAQRLADAQIKLGRHDEAAWEAEEEA